MESDALGRPLYVRDGLRIIREIECLSDALAFLRDWPETRRGPIYHSAVRACRAAQAGQLHLDGARNAMQCFARSVGILEVAPVSIEPWMVAPRSGRMPI
ncbi:MULTISPECIES: DUF982 domain-containing protein [Aminobacter]|jgi:hypothetical protein|uniref:DUF982 domain-containing protein n=1 Tax=Aminobacter aminovorans TaxID=83263 RepID=A0AAC9ARV9_AMIAI|nr:MULTISPECIES: DUF982 domain-containing protein [Aminobacter]AMS42494.1 hypothetical protein AA2016_3572 [Aminobacter aminovorans]MBB3707782.1 hypothetical protein [Aminobacter aminovorans]QOF73638.1 DUF982 domain-containing protein [Aminobacter sp. SR38]